MTEWMIFVSFVSQKYLRLSKFYMKTLSRISIILMIFLSSAASAQYFNGQNTFWKTQKQSIGFGLGVSNFLGELGGRNQVGSDFIYDLEWSQTRPALFINYRYQFATRLYAKAQFNYSIIGGNDALTEEIFRRNRNLSFRSSVFELTGQVEFEVVQFSNKTRYNRVATARNHSSAFYLSAGLGGARFNPKGNFDGQWYALRPYGTEGQKQEGGPSQYSLFTVVIPLGIGFRYELNQEWTIGAELVHRITFTDYMDDVSTVYYDNDLIAQTQGELAAHFADPSLGYYVDESGNEIPLNSTFTGAQRGDPSDNDAYFTFTFNAYYKIHSGYKRGKGRTIKRRRRRAVF